MELYVMNEFIFLSCKNTFIHTDFENKNMYEIKQLACTYSSCFYSLKDNHNGKIFYKVFQSCAIVIASNSEIIHSDERIILHEIL